MTTDEIEEFNDTLEQSSIAKSRPIRQKMQHFNDFRFATTKVGPSLAIHKRKKGTGLDSFQILMHNRGSTVTKKSPTANTANSTSKSRDHNSMLVRPRMQTFTGTSSLEKESLYQEQGKEEGTNVISQPSAIKEKVHQIREEVGCKCPKQIKVIRAEEPDSAFTSDDQRYLTSIKSSDSAQSSLAHLSTFRHGSTAIPNLTAQRPQKREPISRKSVQTIVISVKKQGKKEKNTTERSLSPEEKNCASVSIVNSVENQVEELECNCRCKTEEVDNLPHSDIASSLRYSHINLAHVK